MRTSWLKSFAVSAGCVAILATSPSPRAAAPGENTVDFDGYAEWRHGDALIVENACVHQHFSDDQDDECITLVMKAKPLFLFMHLLYQKMISYPPNTLPKGHEDWTPPTDL